MSKPNTRTATAAEKSDTKDDGRSELVRETVSDVVARQSLSSRLMPEYFDGVNQDPMDWIQLLEKYAKLNKWKLRRRCLICPTTWFGQMSQI